MARTESVNQQQFLIHHVASLTPGRLEITFADGYAGVVDLRDIIEKYPALARLNIPDVVTSVAPDEWKRGVVFHGDDELALASDNLRALAIEQSGGYSHQQVIIWMHHHALSLDAAAKALGLSRRMLAYYRSGERPIPKTVGLAMLGWEARESGLHLNEHRRVA